MAKTSITAKLGLDTTAFQRGMARSQKSVANFVKSGIAKFGALAGAAGLGAMAESALRLASDITNLSKVANTGTEDFQKFAFAAKTVGVEQDKLADILKDVSDKVGDFLQTGGGPMADFFENIAPKVGVTADQFRNLSGKDALQLYVSSLEKANISQNEMTFFMEAIASDATLLLPLLRDNGQALTELGKEAKRLGLVMDGDIIKKLNAASIEVNKFKTSATILTGIFLTKAIPAFSIFANGIGFVGDVLGIVASNMLSFGRTIGTVLKAVIAPAISQMEALGLAIKAAGQFAKRDFSGAKESINAAKDAAGEMVDEVKAIPGKINDAFSQLAQDGASSVEVLGDAIDKRSKDIEKNMNDIKGAAKDATDEIEKTGNAMNNATGAGGTGSGGASGGRARDKKDGFSDAEIAAAKHNLGLKEKKDSKFGPAPTFRDRERAAGLYNTTLGRDGARLDAMVDKPAKANAVEITQKEATDYLKTIAQELTKTTR